MASSQWTIEEISRLMDLMSSHDVVELDLNDHDFRLRLRKPQAFAASSVPPASASLPSQPLLPPAVIVPQTPLSPAATQILPVLPSGSENLSPIKSPIVGTFYRASAPDAAPFVKEGDIVEKDTVVCIIEAMKIMNEVKAGVTGRIVKILLDNGDPVEYNQAIFMVAPNV